MKTVLVAGGTGFIGSILVKQLVAYGYKVHVLSRNPITIPHVSVFLWNPALKKIDTQAFNKVSHIINLVGDTIFEKRWSTKRMNYLRNSRIIPIDFLMECIEKEHLQIESFVNVSAIGVYGVNDEKKIITENYESKTNDFASSLCKIWEQRALLLEKHTSISIARIGIVVGKGGFLMKLLAPPFVSAFGSGNQLLNWISVNDVARGLIYIMEHGKNKEAYNLVGNEPCTMNELNKYLAVIFKKIQFPNIPKFIAYFILGKRAELLLYSQHISNQKLLDLGFTYEDTSLQEVLQKISEE